MTPAAQTPQPTVQMTGPGGTFWGTPPWFNRPAVPPEPGLTEQQLNQLRQGYARPFGEDVGLSPAERARRQQELQSRGFAGFADPAVLARLNLNDNQVGQINALTQQYNAALANIRAAAQANPAGATRQYESLRRQTLDALSGILVPQQQQAYRELAGRPFDLPATFGAPQQ
jgi:hypothetical protein